MYNNPRFNLGKVELPSPNTKATQKYDIVRDLLEKMTKVYMDEEERMAKYQPIPYYVDDKLDADELKEVLRSYSDNVNPQDAYDPNKIKTPKKEATLLDLYEPKKTSQSIHPVSSQDFYDFIKIGTRKKETTLLELYRPKKASQSFSSRIPKPTDPVNPLDFYEPNKIKTPKKIYYINPRDVIKYIKSQNNQASAPISQNNQASAANITPSNNETPKKIDYINPRDVIKYIKSQNNQASAPISQNIQASTPISQNNQARRANIAPRMYTLEEIREMFNVT